MIRKVLLTAVDGKGANKYLIIKLGRGTSSSIKEKPTAFLYSIVACSSTSTKKKSNQKCSEQFIPHLQHLDKAPVRGEYKVWMYRRYVIPSLHYDLAMNGISVSISKKLNSLATRYIKKCLGLTRSTTEAIIHHPSVLNIPILESCSTSAKLNYLAAMTPSLDSMIEEISHFSLSGSFGHAHGIFDLVLRYIIQGCQIIHSNE